MTAPKKGGPPRHRPRLRGVQLAGIRLAVYTAAGYSCVSCGWEPDPPPPGYDGSYALFSIVSREPTPRDPLRFRVIRLELDHANDDPMRPGPWIPSDFQALCSPCNRTKPKGVAS